MKTDSLFYRLFQLRPQWVFELAGLPIPDMTYTLRAEEVKQTAFRLDGVLWPDMAQGEAPLVFVEAQLSVGQCCCVWRVFVRFWRRCCSSTCILKTALMNL